MATDINRIFEIT